MSIFYFQIFSQGFGEPPKDPPQDWGMFNIQNMKTQLGLTDDQVKKLIDLTDETRKNIEIKQIEVDKVMLSIREEMLKDNPDIAKIKSLVEKKHSIMAEIEVLMIKRDLDIKGILTKEQFDKLRLYFGRMQRKRMNKDQMKDFRNKNKRW